MPKRFLSNGSLLTLLGNATVDERMALTAILDPKASRAYDPIPLQQAICEAGGNGVINFLRGQGTGYVDILDDVVDALEVKGVPSYHGTSVINGLSLSRLEEMILVDISIKGKKVTMAQCLEYNKSHVERTENKILIKLLEKAYANMSAEQKRDFDAKVTDVAKKFGGSSVNGLTTAAGLMVLGNLGGFATFTLMSTLLSTLSFGALGFGAYTAASSLLSLVLGPVGWIGMGGAAIHALGKPELQVTIPLVANIAVIRQRVDHSR
jgi:uncharacterized protein YaaW (UPF0174 family)